MSTGHKPKKEHIKNLNLPIGNKNLSRKQIMDQIKNRIDHNDDQVLLEMLIEYCNLKTNPLRQDEKQLIDFIKNTYNDVILKDPKYINKKTLRMNKIINELTLSIRFFDGSDTILISMGKFKFWVRNDRYSAHSNNITIIDKLYGDIYIELYPCANSPYNYVKSCSKPNYQTLLKRMYEERNNNELIYEEINNDVLNNDELNNDELNNDEMNNEEMRNEDDKEIFTNLMDDIFHIIFSEILWGDAYDPIHPNDY